MKYKIVKAPITALITILGMGIVLILLIFSIVGLAGGALKEFISYLSSSQSFTTKASAPSPTPFDVLVTQE